MQQDSMPIRLLRGGSCALIVLAAVLYLLACLLLYTQQRALLFHPTPSVGPPPAATAETMITAIGVPSADPAIRLAGWMVNPGRERALLYFGGNAERVEDNAAFFSRCLPQHTVYLIGYRGYGDSQGEPSQQAIFDDALRLHRLLKDNGHRRVDAMGRSLGSGVAVYLAAQRDIAKLVLITPYDSIASVGQHHYPWLPVRWLIKDPFHSASYAPQVRSQVKLLIADRDTVIPPAHAHALAQGFSTQPAIREFADADHNDISAHPEYADEVCGFLASIGNERD